MSALALQSFGFEGQTVRALECGGAPWFVAQDVCACLEIVNHRNVVSALDEDEKGVHSMDTLGGDQQVSIVSESGLYSLIFKSRKPAAKRFRKWVTSEVLPTLRTTGRYVMAVNDDRPEVGEQLSLDTPDEMQRVTLKLALVREARIVFGRQTAGNVWAEMGLPDVRPRRLVGNQIEEPPETLRQWLDDRTAAAPDGWVPASELYADYCSWCEISEVPPMGTTAFGRWMTACGVMPKKNRVGLIHRTGIRLKD